ncbi:TetR/AcrR family transcriptional regulator [Catenulispora sp. NF23]|uniref:TetR/AcrR family transcriptional regulator n=1 Tax=Catenulispora pinistramenti TaxID=2705254 RepID=A0ABS5KTZ4_9ACTN|nr:TetR/AcrR family transcriptional regulator [Catenulispora pinistramenti]MBS2535091.1 TetR/AcrR family transcriptional regulator [Catenulispora pinistramenti]MBS2549500.1 TetR/AcrR family transcriptional regulator [Catenulispora pinistramenti]
MGVSTVLAPLPGARSPRDPQRAIKRGPSRVPREQVAATQRDRLYDGLVRTVAERGYANASVSDICRASGVTRPAFYEHFESKQGAFLAAYRHGTDVLFAMLRQAFCDAAQERQAAETGEAGEAGETAEPIGTAPAPAEGDAPCPQAGSAAAAADAPEVDIEADIEVDIEAWARATCSVLAVLLDVLSSVPAFATAAIVEIDAVGPAGRQARAERLRDFESFFTLAPSVPDGVSRAEVVNSVVAGAYGTLYRYIAGGRIAELPELLPGLVYFVVAPFAGPQSAAQAAKAASADHPRSVAPCVPTQADAGVAGE